MASASERQQRTRLASPTSHAQPDAARSSRGSRPGRLPPPGQLIRSACATGDRPRRARSGDVDGVTRRAPHRGAARRSLPGGSRDDFSRVHVRVAVPRLQHRDDGAGAFLSPGLGRLVDELGLRRDVNGLRPRRPAPALPAAPVWVDEPVRRGPGRSSLLARFRVARARMLDERERPYGGAGRGAGQQARRTNPDAQRQRDELAGHRPSTTQASANDSRLGASWGQGAPPPRGVGGGAMSSLQRLQRVRGGPAPGVRDRGKRAYSGASRGMHSPLSYALRRSTQDDARAPRNLPEQLRSHEEVNRSKGGESHRQPGPQVHHQRGARPQGSDRGRRQARRARRRRGVFRRAVRPQRAHRTRAAAAPAPVAARLSALRPARRRGRGRRAAPRRPAGDDRRAW